MDRFALLGPAYGLALGILSGVASADGPPAPAPKLLPSAPVNWTGAYVGTHTGGAAALFVQGSYKFNALCCTWWLPAR